MYPSFAETIQMLLTLSAKRRYEFQSSCWSQDMRYLCHLQGDAVNNEMMHAFREGAAAGDIQATSRKRQMQAKILKEMIAIDKQRALVTMKSWATFVELASGRQHHTHYSSLDEYIPYRSIDVGHMYYSLLWAPNLHLLISLKVLARPGNFWMRPDHS